MNRLKQLRKDKKLTLKGLAKELVDGGFFESMTDATLTRYENGKREPKLETWKKLADYFDVSIQYLQGLSTERHSDKKDGLRDLSVDLMQFLNADFLPNNEELIEYFNEFISNLEKTINYVSDIDRRSALDMIYSGNNNYLDGIYKVQDDKNVSIESVLHSSAYTENEKYDLILTKMMKKIQELLDTKENGVSQKITQRQFSMHPQGWNDIFNNKISDVELSALLLSEATLSEGNVIFYNDLLSLEISEVLNILDHVDAHPVDAVIISLDSFIKEMELEEEVAGKMTTFITALKNNRV